MALLEGLSLDALQAARRVLSVEEALGYADQILDVLAAAHARGIIHRDIKPQNVFITAAGVAKVLDFGVARLFDGTASMTATGSFVGTPAFMPPEQAGGRLTEIGPASDLWSLGATVFNLLTGRFVHESQNVQQHTVKAAVQPARSIATLRPDLPAPLVAWVDKALSFDIPRRFQTAAEMREALARVRGQIGGAPRFSDPGVVRAPQFSDPGPMPPPRFSDPGLMPAPRFSDPGPVPSGAPMAPDAVAIARVHGLPPPAPKRELTRAEKGGIAGVAVVFVLVVGLVVRALVSKGSGPPTSASSKPTGTGLSVWLGSSGAPNAGDVPPRPTEPSPAATSTLGLVAEELRAALEAGETEARRCTKKVGPKGRVSVQVTFHPEGTTAAQVEIAFNRTQVGTCVEESFRNKARVKPFEGAPVTVTRMVFLSE